MLYPLVTALPSPLVWWKYVTPFYQSLYDINKAEV